MMQAKAYADAGTIAGTKKKVPAVRAAGGARHEPVAAPTAGDEFAWVPEWLSDPAPPTPAAKRAAQMLREHAKK